MFKIHNSLLNKVILIPHYRINNYEIKCLATNEMGWEHVSVTIQEVGKKAKRNPTWEEMCYVKNFYWNEEDCVVQYHPPKSQYIDNHPHCLHLWAPLQHTLPIPDSSLVGLKGLTPKHFDKI